MGCWNESCAITGYPVMPNQPVLMFITKKQFTPIRPSCGFALWEQVSYIGFGTYNDYGWLNELDRDAFCSVYEPEEDDKEAIKRPDFRSLFIHKNVVDSIIKLIPLKDPKKDIKFKIETESYERLCKLYPDNDWKFKKPKFIKNIEYLESIVRFADVNRIDLSSPFAFKGAQHVPDKKHWNLLIKMMKEQQKILDKYYNENL